MRRKAQLPVEHDRRTDAAVRRRATTGAAYMPLQGFTAADLGYERGNAVSNIVTKHRRGADRRAATSSSSTRSGTTPSSSKTSPSASTSTSPSVYAENSPERIYFLILYNLFAEFLEDISEDVLPNDRPATRTPQIWKKLYNFQRDAATGIINKLETYNGCILADSVGLGKTFTALAVIKYYELRNKSVLVLCPKKLADNWTNYNANLTTNIFASDRFNYDVLAHTDLSRTRASRCGIPLDRVNWGNYDLVVIDESHNFRNADYAEEKETRYQRLMRQVIQQGVKTKVLMLSATPVNNRFNDLRNQLALAYEGESENSRPSSTSTTSDREGLPAKRSAPSTSGPKLPPKERTTDAILHDARLRLLRAARRGDDRPLPQAHPGVLRHRRDRRVPRAASSRCRFAAPLTDLPEVPTFNEIFEQLQALTLAVYTPLAYVFPSRMQKYEELYDTSKAGTRARQPRQRRPRAGHSRSS